jgi:tripartite-type tricarboxylate transporter receptor subunit TctC
MRLWIAIAALLSLASPAPAQTYPSQPIRFIVPFAPGGGSDILARILGDPLSKRLGQPVVIENKPGGGATVGADLVAKARPDGYTILLTTAGPQITNPYLLPKLPYDPNKDLVPVVMLVKAVNVLVVTKDLPVKNVAELIAYAKANPGKINFSSSGIGASSHLSGEMFKMMAGIDIVHVPYRGSGPSIQDILAGSIQMSIDTVSTMLPHIQSGGMRALAVAGTDKNPTLPDLPTVSATLPGFDGDSINYISVPAGVPQAVIDRLNKEFNAVLTDPDVVKRMITGGMTPVVETQADLIKRVKSEQVKWKKVIEAIK